MPSIVETIAPSRLGSDFRRLFGAAALSNLADGLILATGGLLLASLTDNATIVAAGLVLQRLPWVLFGLHVGVMADRFDRRRLIGGANLFRSLLLAGLVVVVGLQGATATLVLVVLFLLGTAEVIADTTSTTILPMLVESEDLGVANARLIATQTVVNLLIGPSGGAILFAIDAAVPFALQSFALAAAALLLVRLSAGRPSTPSEVSSIRGEIAAGLRSLWMNPPVRILTITIVTFNVTFGASWAVLVLYARDRLQLEEVGFGLLISVSAVGGIVAAGFYNQIEARFPLSQVVRIGLVIETLTHLGLAVTTSVAVAFAILFLFGAHAAIWGTIATTIRQRTVPQELQGRVNSVYLLGSNGALVVGAALGGVLADQFGVTAPYWFGFVASAIYLVAVWNPLANVVATNEADTGISSAP